MSQPNDAWYVRFPDGRIIRAANTTVLRRNLHTGRVPAASTVRRSPEDEWVKLEWTEEFADYLKSQPTNGVAKKAVRKKKRRVVRSVEPASAGDRLDPQRFNLVGSQRIFREMLAALDGTIMPKKLLATAGAGVGFGVLAALSQAPLPDLGVFHALIPWTLAFAALFVFAALSGVLTHMTFLELSELRPARLRAGLTGLVGRTLRLLFTWVFALGIVVLLIAGLHWATAWLVAPLDMPWPLAREITANMLSAVSLVLEGTLGPIFGLSLLLSPILVVEECSAFRAVRTWRVLLRLHFRSLLTYEATAVVVAMLIALPFALPLLLSGWLNLDEHLFTVVSVTRAALWGLLFALPAAYLVVANVFIYLNVRYETGSERVAAGS